MDYSPLLSSDFSYEISAAGDYALTDKTVGIVLGTTMDDSNYITTTYAYGDAVNQKDYLLKQVPYAIKPKSITIVGTVKVQIFERVNMG
jgi:hypothetical protein